MSHPPHGERRYPSLSTRGPRILLALVLVLSVVLTTLWHVALVNDYQKLREIAQDQPFHWGVMALGSVLFLAIIILLSILGSQLINHIHWSQRQSNFIASVSHELNSPLSSIKLFAQTLRKPDMSVEDRLDFVGKILFDVDRLQRLIANILRAAEVDNHEELPVATRRLELFGYLESYCKDMAAFHHEHQLGLELEGERDVWVELDPLAFRQVLDNLLDNAVRYAGDAPPRVVLRLGRDDGHVVLRVIDQGVGVPESDLPNLFERFYRVNEGLPLRGRKGTGIGLFVVRSIVQAHGGQVEALSDGALRGTEIRVRLPVAASQASGTNVLKVGDRRGKALEPHSAR